jgi:hypothetical protein
VRFGRFAIVRRFDAAVCAFLMFRFAAAVCFVVAMPIITSSRSRPGRVTCL